MKYHEMKQKHQAAMGELPIAFAFSEKQLNEAAEKLGAELSELVRVCCGGIMKKSDVPLLTEFFKSSSAEMDEAFNDDAFLIDALVYELGNHEYCITADVDDALSALGLDPDDARIKRCMPIALKTYNNMDHGW